MVLSIICRALYILAIREAKKLMTRDNIPYNHAKRSIEDNTSASCPVPKQPPSSTSTWSKVVSKAVGTVRPRNVATQTTTKVNIGIQDPEPYVLIMSSASTQTDPPKSSDLVTQASPQTLQAFDTPSPVAQSLSFREDMRLQEGKEEEREVVVREQARCIHRVLLFQI